jgi:hypothetical protein
VTPTITVPSEWLFAYFFGFVLWYLLDQKVEDLLTAFSGVMAYFLVLTIGLRLYYGS